MKLFISLTILSVLITSATACCDTQYTVQSGDYCDLIAGSNQLSLDDFLALNPGLNCDNLQIGASVCVQGTPHPQPTPTPTPAPTPTSTCNAQYTIQSGDYCDLIASNNQLSLDDFLALNPDLNCDNLQIGAIVCVQGTQPDPTPPPTPVSACNAQYTIQSGDYCDLIASNNQLSLDNFLALNPDLNCDNLQIGAVVCVQGTQPSPNPDPTPTPTPDPNGISITYQQFVQAVTGTNGYPTPSEDQYTSFINNYASAGGISTTRELAMFLSEILWESGGLQFKSELRCEGNNCAGDYRSPGDDPNLFYYGRGYIQLTWSYNYKAASEALFGDDRLVTDPDQVSSNEDVAWETAFWFWKTNVHGDAGVQSGQFGSATNAINGGLECNPCRGNCGNRNNIYAYVLQTFGVNEAPNYAGC